ncbi:MAG: HAD-IC family P-type ATPase, partial [Firmicutes bacterium]|nr:HAD-IC family P-type ATPase [Candidatus Colimorpha enterica]
MSKNKSFDIKKTIDKLFKRKESEYKLTCDNAVRFNPDPDMGLSEEQVERRINEGLSNVTNNKASKTVGQIFLTNIFTYFNILFMIITIVLVSVNTSIGNLTFLVIVVANTVIGIIQELRAKDTLEKLTLVSSPLTKTIRDGNEEQVNSDDLVLDDIVIFSAGNQIPADAVVIDGEVNVNESLVTGESDEIKKVQGSNLLSGSYIVSGTCRAQLTRVGNESFAATLANDAKKIQKKQKPGMMKSLTLLIKIIGFIIIPLAALTFYNQHYILKYPVKESVESMAGSVLGMIPDGLYLLTTIALAASAIRLAKRNTLVHDMKCIETLAGVDVICVDKTGTVTEPEMHLQDIESIGGEMTDGALRALIRDFVMNMTSDSLTMTALKEHFNDRNPYKKASRIKGFSSATKFSAVTYGGNMGYLLGAPEFMMRDEYECIREQAEAHSSNGERVLLFAEYVFDEDNDIFADGQFGGNVIPLGLVTLKNRVRPEARETFGYFAEQGVEVKVISGDNPITVSKAAEEAGIVGYDKFVDATTLNSKEKIAKAATEYTVFGRVT